MLMSTLADRYAHRLLDARARARCIPPLSASAPLSLADAYDIAQRLLARSEEHSLNSSHIQKSRMPSSA